MFAPHLRTGSSARTSTRAVAAGGAVFFGRRPVAGVAVGTDVRAAAAGRARAPVRLARVGVTPPFVLRAGDRPPPLPVPPLRAGRAERPRDAE